MANRSSKASFFAVVVLHRTIPETQPRRSDLRATTDSSQSSVFLVFHLSDRDVTLRPPASPTICPLVNASFCLLSDVDRLGQMTT